MGKGKGAWKDILGEHSPNLRNKNRERLLDICAYNDLVVTNTLLKDHPCHHMTWYHLAEGVNRGHMIDYVLVNQLFRSSMFLTPECSEKLNYIPAFGQFDHTKAYGSINRPP